METNAETFVPILFKVLLAFICLNMAINTFLLITRKLKIYRLMAIYWPSLLGVFTILSIFQTGDLEVTLAYGSSIISCTIFSLIGFEVIGKKFPIRNYTIGYLLAFPATYLLHDLGYSFSIIATPMALATGIPLFHTFIRINFLDRNTTTKLQKILGIVYLLQAIHCVNFALFRMDPGAQLWGWLVAYAIYDTVAILLPAIALEDANRTESVRLQNLVDIKTTELNKSLKANEDLLKVVLHDISSPIMTMRFYLSIIQQTPENEVLIEKVKKSQSAMENIILQVKDLYGKRRNKDSLHLKAVSLEDCFNEVEFIYSQNLEKKRIGLRFNNLLPKDTKVLADQTSLTHSVLSNLISNALKFSKPNTYIEVTARIVSDSLVLLEVKDQGPGISQNIIQNILEGQESDSSEGTSGEVGSGLGLSIVKSFIDSYGGQIEFDSKHPDAHPYEHGTNIKIALHRA